MSGPEKLVLRLFDKHHNQNNKTSEVEALQLLSQLPNPAAVRDDDEHQFTLLHHACWNGWYEVSQVLIEKYNCDPKCKTASGSIPLRLACWSGNLDLVNYLINEKQNDPKHKNNRGFTSLHTACSGGKLEMVKYLIEVQHCDPTCKSNSGLTPLHLACDYGHLDVTKYLVDQNNCEVTCTNYAGWTPLHSACQKGHLDVAEYLIDEKGCDSGCTGNDSWTPLLLACYNGHLGMVKYLIDEKNCDTYFAVNDGYTPLHLACQNGHLGVALYLVEEQHCDPVGMTKDGCTPLHLACRNGHIHIAKYLVKFYGLSIYESRQNNPSPFSLAFQKGHLNISTFFTENLCDGDMQGTLPLHVACIKGVLEVVKFLIEDQQCDPQLKDGKGQTPLHLACENGHKCIVEYLMDKHDCYQTGSGSTPFSIAEKGKHDDVALFVIEKQLSHQCHKYKNDSQWSVLHSACQVGELEFIKFLVKHVKLHCKDSNGLTPLHIACENGHMNVVKFLIEEEKCDTNSKTPHGISPLHLACRNGHFDLVVYLVSEHIDLSSLPDSDSTHMFDEAYAGSHNDIAFFLLSCGLKYRIGNHTGLLQPALKVFIIGNSLTGKSTLIKAILSNIKDRGRFSLNQLVNRKVTGVKPHTAGIIPYHAYIDHGYIILYDFAGQYEHYSSSHAAVLEKLRSADGTLVLIVVDISKKKEELIQQLQYWNSFVDNQYEPNLPKPPVIVIGSHDDIAKSNGRQVLSDALNEFPDLTVSITLNCTQKFSIGLKEVCTHISTHSQRHYCEFTASTQTHFLNRLLDQKFQGQIACQLSEIFDSIAQENASLSKHYLLPTDLVSLSQQLSILSKHGQIIFLNNPKHVENSWVVLKKDLLLSDINGSIFAPEKFHAVHKDFSSTGIVALSKVNDTFPKYDPEMLVSFMIQLDFCFEVDESEVTLISGGQYHTANVLNEKYYLFPALVSVQRPTDYCQVVTKNFYKFGWCLQCKSGQCFTSRFLHVLLLRLAFSFVLPTKSPPAETHPLEIKRRECNIWIGGIHWQNTNGVETIVEVVEQNTAVMVTMGCSEKSVIKCIRLRSAVIQTILSTKDQFSGAVKAEESLLHPHELTKYPQDEVKSLYTFPLSSLATAIQERGEVLTNKIGPDQRKVEIENLLHFEPYACFTCDIILKLIEESNIDEEVSDVFLRDCARVAHPHMDKLKDILLMPEHDCEYNTAVKEVCDQYSDDSTHKCFHIFKTWTKFTKNRTYKGLKEALDKYSIFCGRNPLGFAIHSPNGGGQHQI